MPSKRDLATQLAQAERQLAEANAQQAHLAERLADLEFAVEDQGWTELHSTYGAGSRRIDRGSLMAVVERCRLMATLNPLVKRGVGIRSEYVFGQGVQLSATEQDSPVADVLADLQRDPTNARALFGHGAQLQRQKDLDTDGNVLLALFTDQGTGQVRVRCVPIEQVQRVHRDPEDAVAVRFYERHIPQPGGGTRKVLHPDLSYVPVVAAQAAARTVGGLQVAWNAPVVHVYAGTPTTLGLYLPDIVAALDWARAYHDFLTDFATIVRSLSQFAWQLTTKAGKTGAARTKLGTTFGTATTGASTAETNPAYVPGSVFISDEAVSMTPMAKSGATVDVESGKPLRLMAGMALGLPDTILSGDADQGTLATARSLDRPTELTMGSLQRIWSEALVEVAGWAVEARVRAGRLPGNVLPDPYGGRQVVVRNVDDAGAEATFPPILEHDLGGMVTALVQASKLQGVDPYPLVRMLYSVLGVEDADEYLAELAEQVEAQRADAEAMADAEQLADTQEVAEALGRMADDLTDVLSRVALR